MAGDAGEHPAEHQLVERPDRVPVGEAAEAAGIEHGRLVDRHVAGAGHHLEREPAPAGQLHLGGEPQPPWWLADLDPPAGEGVAGAEPVGVAATAGHARPADQLVEPLLIHERMDRRDALRRGIEALEAVGINDAERRMQLYPHEFSGGMRQRVMIAMALITRPELLIADEPTTALDVTVQAQILELIRARQRELGMAVIFITHDLGVVAGLCDRVQVMYAGRIVETAPTRDLFSRPLHPYTRALQRSIPALQRKGAPLYSIEGLPPDLSRPLPGCSFAPRCARATPACSAGSPALRPAGGGHAHACDRVHAGEI